MSNNTIELGGKPINYNEESKKNPYITTLTYASLGLSGAIDVDGNGFLDANELISQGDRDVIHNKLMNPQTDEEVKIAALSLAEFLNLKTEALFNAERIKVGIGATYNPPEDFEDDLSEEDEGGATDNF